MSESHNSVRGRDIRVEIWRVGKSRLHSEEGRFLKNEEAQTKRPS